MNTRERLASKLRARKSFRRNVGRAVLHALTWFGAAGLYYIAISFFFDTPYEHYLKQSSISLREQYSALQSRYDSLDMVLDNIEQRDRNIFNMMFESEPYDFESEYNERQIALHESLLNKSNKELKESLESRCNALERGVTQLQKSSEEMIAKVTKSRQEGRNIPAIQPIANRQLTLLTASYGERIHPFYKTIHPHQGVDYTIPEETRVFATADGIVKSYTMSNSTSGKSMVLDHGNGYQTVYSHLSKIFIPRNKRYKRGDIIGLSGNTGLSLSPHLHYEVRYNDMRVDPIHYFFMELTPTEYQKIIKIAQSGMQSFD